MILPFQDSFPIVRSRCKSERIHRPKCTSRGIGVEKKRNQRGPSTNRTWLVAVAFNNRSSPKQGLKITRPRSCFARTGAAMAASFVPFHVTPYAEGFPAAGVGTFEGFLPRMRMAVYAQARGSRESFVASLANVTILRLPRKSCRGRWRDVVMMLMLPRTSLVDWRLLLLLLLLRGTRKRRIHRNRSWRGRRRWKVRG